MSHGENLVGQSTYVRRVRRLDHSSVRHQLQPVQRLIGFLLDDHIFEIMSARDLALHAVR